MRTGKVKQLVNEVLDALPRPYTEDVIDEVFFAIEQNPRWRERYDEMCAELGRTVVNTWGGFWIANALGKQGEREVPSRKSALIVRYSILDTDAKPRTRRPKEAEALQMMSDYYRAHRAELPPDVARHRELIIELIMAGLPPQEAFAMVFRSEA